MLKPIEHLKFYEQWHRYRYKDNWLARSVTQILSFDLTDEAKHWINVTKDGPDGWKVRARLCTTSSKTSYVAENSRSKIAGVTGQILCSTATCFAVLR